MTDMNFEDVRWLTSPTGEAALAELANYATQATQLQVQAASRLRKIHSAARVHLLLEQLELRWRAREKFERSSELYYTRKGFEQASDDFVARAKAARFPEHASLADLCCGIGGDLMQLAARGPTIGYDADAVTAHLAVANLSGCRLRESSARNEFADESAVANVSAWHIDPDRRSQGKRVVDIEDYEPGPELLRRLLRVNPHGAIKLAPAAQLSTADWPPLERQWLGSRGECRQQVLWFGNLMQREGCHTATDVDATFQCHSFSGLPTQPLQPAEQVAGFVLEPSATVLAAQLAGAMASEFELQAITPGGGYLTADQLPSHPLLGAFRVRDVLSFDQRKLRAYCRAHKFGQLEIKKRGVDIDPSRVRRELLAKGDESAVILIAKLGKSVKAIVADRVVR